MRSVATSRATLMQRSRRALPYPFANGDLVLTVFSVEHPRRATSTYLLTGRDARVRVAQLSICSLQRRLQITRLNVRNGHLHSAQSVCY
jgi:hypothetical protein